MARGRKPRTWIKIDCDGILRGSVNYLLALDGQAVWVKMIALSEVCGGRPGYIEDNNEKGLPLDYIAHELHCEEGLLNTVIERMTNDGAIETNGSGSIHLVNFHHYQFSEYDRQKPSRDRKKAEKQINKICDLCGYKAKTNETLCPECEKNRKESYLVRDYTTQKYGHMVQR